MLFAWVPSLPLWSVISAGREKLSLPSSRFTDRFAITLFADAPEQAFSYPFCYHEAARPTTSRPIPTYLTRLRIDFPFDKRP